MCTKVISEEIYQKLSQDEKHKTYYETIQSSTNCFEIFIPLFQFLEIHSSLCKKITYDNIEFVLRELIYRINPNLMDEYVLKVSIFLLKQDFLYENLNRHRQKMFKMTT